jgi:hypothetical protein
MEDGRGTMDDWGLKKEGEKLRKSEDQSISQFLNPIIPQFAIHIKISVVLCDLCGEYFLNEGRKRRSKRTKRTKRSNEPKEKTP